MNFFPKTSQSRSQPNKMNLETVKTWTFSGSCTKFKAWVYYSPLYHFSGLCTVWAWCSSPILSISVLIVGLFLQLNVGAYMQQMIWQNPIWTHEHWHIREHNGALWLWCSCRHLVWHSDSTLTLVWVSHTTIISWYWANAAGLEVFGLRLFILYTETQISQQF